MFMDDTFRHALKRLALCGVSLLLALAAAAAQAQLLPETPQFRRLGVEQGLPSSRINDLAQDRAGYLWIATDDGVARFDGVDFRVWRYNPGVVNGMQGNLVNSLYVDRNDDVWLGVASGGLARIDAQRGAVEAIPEERVPGMKDGEVWSMTETADGRLWFATFGSGLYSREPDGNFVHHGPLPTGANGTVQPKLISMATDRDGVLWVGTLSGLSQRLDEEFVAVDAGPIDNEIVMGLFPESDGSMWIATRTQLWRRTAQGRYEPSPWAEQLVGLRVHGVQRDGRGGVWVHTSRGLFFDGGQGLRRLPALEAAEGDYQNMLIDRQGSLWFGDSEYGVVWLSSYWRSFATFSRAGAPGMALSMRQALALAKAPDGSLLLGGDDGRVDRIAADGRSVQRDILPKALLGENRVLSLLQREDGSLWVGTGRDLFRRDTGGAWQQWTRDSANAVPAGPIDFMVPMPDGSVWLSSYGGGLQQRAADGRVLKQVSENDGLGLTAPDAEQLLLGPDGALWVANQQGVLRWNGERFERMSPPGATSVQGMAFVDATQLWTYRLGVLERYRVEGEGLVLEQRADVGDDGLLAAEVGGIALDAAGRVWMTSVRGLMRYDPATRSTRLFGPGDGLADREFGLRPPLVLPDGRILAGTVSGALLFDPMTVAPDSRVSDLLIESIAVRRAEDLVNLDPALPIVLQPEDRDLRVVARLMSFSDPATHRYRFRLHGYDPDWVEVGANGERLLPRQSPGDYRLEIVAAGADGRWGTSTSLNISVLPPWWRTWWAQLGFGLAGLLTLLLAAAGYRFRVQRQTEKRRVEEQRRMEQQASEAKSTFLANLGHELRTPLTGVLGMAELLLNDSLPDTQKQRVETVQRAGQHLLRLVNDTLDLARIEAGRLSLHSEPFDVSSLLGDVAQLLRPLAEAKGLEFQLVLAPGLPPRLRGDEARVRQILLNLGSNAIKFTAQGKVAVRASAREGGGFSVEVEDTGIGITLAQQRHLFQRFEQAEGANTAKRFGGTGLGLAISRELAGAMGGTLLLKSQKDVGSCFTLELPLPEVSASASVTSLRREPAQGKSTPLHILLVEDEPVVAEVVVGLLTAQGHTVYHAPQALAALSLLKTERIDFGLLDLDLPAVDGFELARLIRQNGWTLPLVALTARAGADAEKQARAAGMDGFLRKPATGDMLAEALAGFRQN